MSTNFDAVMSSPETAPAPRRGLELRRAPSFVVGGLPTVSLIPRELKAAARGRSVRRLLIVGVAAAAAHGLAAAGVDPDAREGREVRVGEVEVRAADLEPVDAERRAADCSSCCCRRGAPADGAVGGREG